MLGIPLYAVSVAAEVDGSVVAGAVANPVSGELFRAHLGGGAYLDGERLSGPREVALEQAVIVTGFAYDSAMRRRQMAVAAPLLPRIADLRRLGSAALDLCFVAAGRCDASYEAGLNPWDYAAGALIAAEAGCVVGGLRGGPPRRACARPPGRAWRHSCGPCWIAGRRRRQQVTTGLGVAVGVPATVLSRSSAADTARAGATARYLVPSETVIVFDVVFVGTSAAPGK